MLLYAPDWLRALWNLSLSMRRALAVWLLGPMVKVMGFSTLLWIMAGIAAVKAAIVLLLPDEPAQDKAAPA